MKILLGKNFWLYGTYNNNITIPVMSTVAIANNADTIMIMENITLTDNGDSTAIPDKLIKIVNINTSEYFVA